MKRLRHFHDIVETSHPEFFRTSVKEVYEEHEEKESEEKGNSPKTWHERYELGTFKYLVNEILHDKLDGNNKNNGFEEYFEKLRAYEKEIERQKMLPFKFDLKTR